MGRRGCPAVLQQCGFIPHDIARHQQSLDHIHEMIQTVEMFLTQQEL